MTNQIISVVKQCPAAPVAALPYRFYLTETGDGQGAFNFVGDYSSTAKNIYFEAEHYFEIFNLLINISGPSKFLQVGYGSLANPLTNGVKFYVQETEGGPNVPLLYNPGVKKNNDWLEITNDAHLTQWDGQPQTLSIDLDLLRLFGTPFAMRPGMRFKVVLNDNFTGLGNQSFRLAGKYYINN